MIFQMTANVLLYNKYIKRYLEENADMFLTERKLRNNVWGLVGLVR